MYEDQNFIAHNNEPLFLYTGGPLHLAIQSKRRAGSVIVIRSACKPLPIARMTLSVLDCYDYSMMYGAACFDNRRRGAAASFPLQDHQSVTCIASPTTRPRSGRSINARPSKHPVKVYQRVVERDLDSVISSIDEIARAPIPGHQAIKSREIARPQSKSQKIWMLFRRPAKAPT